MKTPFTPSSIPLIFPVDTACARQGKTRREKKKEEEHFSEEHRHAPRSSRNWTCPGTGGGRERDERKKKKKKFVQTSPHTAASAHETYTGPDIRA